MAFPFSLFASLFVRRIELVRFTFLFVGILDLLHDPLLVPVLRNTIIVGVGTIAAMLAFTVPCAWLYTRSDLPRKDLLIALLTVKIAVPGFLVAMGYIFLFNPSNGIGNQLIERAFGVHAFFNVYSLGWIALLQGAALTPPAFFMLVPTMRAIDTTLEDLRCARRRVEEHIRAVVRRCTKSAVGGLNSGRGAK